MWIAFCLVIAPASPLWPRLCSTFQVRRSRNRVWQLPNRRARDLSRLDGGSFRAGQWPRQFKDPDDACLLASRSRLCSVYFGFRTGWISVGEIEAIKQLNSHHPLSLQPHCGLSVPASVAGWLHPSPSSRLGTHPYPYFTRTTTDLTTKCTAINQPSHLPRIAPSNCWVLLACSPTPSHPRHITKSIQL